MRRRPRAGRIGGQWVNHMTIPRFTTKVRTEDLKAMDNYTTKKPSYIYNIMNMSDNLQSDK